MKNKEHDLGEYFWRIEYRSKDGIMWEKEKETVNIPGGFFVV